MFGDSDTQTLAVWGLSHDKKEFIPKNREAKSLHSNLPSALSYNLLIFVIYNNKHYWLYKEMLHEVKWVRSSVTEYYMIENFS